MDPAEIGVESDTRVPSKIHIWERIFWIKTVCSLLDLWKVTALRLTPYLNTNDQVTSDQDSRSSQRNIGAHSWWYGHSVGSG